MAYSTSADIQASPSLLRRITAAAAREKVYAPEPWAASAMWDMASQPGWTDAWESAVAAGKTDPGADDSVITDAMILSAVQALTVDARVGK